MAFSTQPLASDKYNDPCACAGDAASGGALAARASGYGLGSLGAAPAQEHTVTGRPEPLLPCALRRWFPQTADTKKAQGHAHADVCCAGLQVRRAGQVRAAALAA